MSGAIEKTEDIAILVLLAGLCVVAFLLYEKFLAAQRAGGNLVDSALGGAGATGQPGYVSGQQNASRWSDTLFGTPDQESYDGDSTSPNVALQADQSDLPLSEQNPTSWSIQYGQDAMDQLLPLDDAPIPTDGIDGNQLLDAIWGAKVF